MNWKVTKEEIVYDIPFFTVHNLSKDTEKKKLKTAMIDEITTTLDTIPFHDRAFHEIFSKAQPNNAYFMAFKRYHEYADELELIFEQNNGDLAKFIAQFSE